MTFMPQQMLSGGKDSQSFTCTCRVRTIKHPNKTSGFKSYSNVYDKKSLFPGLLFSKGELKQQSGLQPMHDARERHYQGYS